jgi:hypothetical protein
MDPHTATVPITTTVQAQAAGVDGTQADAVGWKLEVGQDAPDFIDAQHDGEFVGGTRPEEFEAGPGLAQGVLEEELDGAQRECGSRAGDAFLVAEIEEILTQFFVGDLIGRFVIGSVR